MDGELTHHGILGMHWGVRRTPAELGHAPKGEKSSGSGSEGQKKESTSTSSSGQGSKRVSEMSDEELRARLNRLNMEEQYASILARRSEASKSRLSKMADKALSQLGDRAVGWAVDMAANAILKKKDTKFDINDYKDMAPEKMDPDTLKKVVQWYTNAELLTKKRSESSNK